MHYCVDNQNEEAVEIIINILKKDKDLLEKVINAKDQTNISVF